jgi:hypothetical protein
MADLFRCQHCGGTGDLTTVTNQETGEYHVESCLSCGGFGFVTALADQPRVRPIADPIELAINAIETLRGKK